MPANRSHHYVPQFLLRQFASDAGQKHVCLFRVANRRLVREASIRDQAARDFFYGTDGKLEHGFAKLEGKAARVVHAIVRRDSVPEPFSREIGVFHLFVLTQWARTPAAVAMFDAQVTGFVRESAKTHPKPPPGLVEGLEHVTVKFKDALRDLLASAMKYGPVIRDLRLKILRSVCSAEFVLGDAPVVRHNQWLRRIPIGSVGFAAAGLQIFLPLSPTDLAILYDTDVYHIGPSAPDIIQVSDPREVHAFNRLQFAAAQNSIYFRSPETAAALQDFPDTARATQHGLDIARMKEIGGDSQLVMTLHRPLNVDLPPGVVRIRHEKATMPNDERCAHRNLWRAEAMTLAELLGPKEQARGSRLKDGAVFKRADD